MIKGEYELPCRYDARANFGGKATVVVYDNGDEDLVSYRTVVAHKRGNIIRVNGWYSMTTGRHINEYLQQNGFNKITKEEMQNKKELVIGEYYGCKKD